MTTKTFFRRTLLLVVALLGSIAASAQEAYAYISREDLTTATFYYDDLRSEREESGHTFNINIAGESGVLGDWGIDIKKVVFTSSFDAFRPTTTKRWFSGMKKLTTITDIQYLHTDNVTNMSDMFLYCTSLTSVDVSGFNTDNVTDMSGMFFNCTSLTSVDVSGFNTDNVTDMGNMFSFCTSLRVLDLSGWNTQNVTNMIAMFNSCQNLTSLDLSGWNTQNVTNMYKMFSQCFNLSILDLSDFNTSNVTTMEWMFYQCSSLSILDLSGFNTSCVTAMERMFYQCRNLTTLDVSGFNTSNVTTMEAMFYECKSLTSLDLSNFNTSKVTKMGNLFYYCDGLRVLDLSGFNTINVTDMHNMFSNDYSLTTIYAGNGWKTSAVQDSEHMFSYCKSLVGSAGTAYDYNYTDITYARLDGGTASPGYFSAKPYAVYENGTLTFYCDINRNTHSGTIYELNKGSENPEWVVKHHWDITHVVFDASFTNARPMSTYRWFYGMTSLTSISGIEYLHTDRVTNMAGMFVGCSELTTLDLSGFDTQNVTNMAGMFYGSNALTSLDLSGWDTQNVTDMRQMFYNCSSLTTIYVSDGWTTDAVTASENMFTGCTSLVGNEGTTFNINHTDKIYAHIDGGPSRPGYLSRKWNAYAVYNNGTLTFYCDDNPSTHPGTAYDLNTGTSAPGWTAQSGNVTSVVFATSFANARPTSTYKWFYHMTNIAEITGMANLNTSRVTTMESMFDGCSNLTALNLSGLNTSNVTDMQYMFWNCNKLASLDVSGWNTRKVTNMSYMFKYCYDLTELDLYGWNTAKVTDMNEMFAGCRSLTTIYVDEGWNTDAVIIDNSYNMFSGCTSLVGSAGTAFDPNFINKIYAHIDSGEDNPGYLSEKPKEAYAVLEGSTLTFYYDWKRETREGEMYDLPSNGSIPDWTSYNNGQGNTTVTTVSFDESFENYTGLESTRHWFYYMTALSSIDYLDYLNTDNVTDMSCMFQNCTSLENLDITSLNTANVTDMSAMFSGCSSLTALEATILNTANVTDMSSMFSGCSSLTFLDVAGLNTANVTNMNNMFCDCQALENLDVSNFITDNVTGMRSMFADCHALTDLDVTNFNTENVTDMYYMFHGCWALTDLDVTDFNTANVTDMAEMFSSCFSLTSLDVSGFNTANVTRMPQMFGYCRNLESINVSNFDMTSVTDTRWMFKDCLNLTTIYCADDWSQGVVSESEGMFDSCSSLQGAVPYDTENDNDISFANPDHGYFTGAEAYAVVDKANESLTYYYDCNKSSYTDDENMDVLGVVDNDWNSYMYPISFVTIDQSMAKYHGLTTTSGMFSGLYEVRGKIEGLRYLNTEHVVDMSHMFEGCQNLDSLDLSHFNTSQVTDMSYMFDGCSALENLDLSSFNTSQVTDMFAMFNYCSALKSVDLSSFNTSQVEGMAYMFNQCNSLRSLDLTNFNMSNVSDVEAMFYGCGNLTTIYCNDNWGDYPLSDCDAEMFFGCVNLEGAEHFLEGNDNSDWANPDTGYFTRKLLLGDVNNDGFVTIADATALVNIILGNATGNENEDAADMNGDGYITTADVKALVKMILRK